VSIAAARVTSPVSSGRMSVTSSDHRLPVPYGVMNRASSMIVALSEINCY
jgi:hypothetical protein